MITRLSTVKEGAAGRIQSETLMRIMSHRPMPRSTVLHLDDPKVDSAECSDLKRLRCKSAFSPHVRF